MSDNSKSPTDIFKQQAKSHQDTNKSGNAEQRDNKSTPDWRQNTPSKRLPTPPELVPGAGSSREKPPEKKPSDDLTVIFEEEKEPMVWWRVMESDEPTKDGYSFALTLKDENTTLALDGSDIDQLELSKDGVLVAEFKNGWVKIPETDRDWDELEQLKTQFTDTEKQFYSIARGQDQDKDRGR